MTLDEPAATHPCERRGTDRLQNTDLIEVAELCEDAYRVVAPKRLIRVLDRGPVQVRLPFRL